MDTFGPFLIPAVVFLIGVIFYALVVVLSRLRDSEDYRTGDSGE
ncbi:hypothetical protein [Natronomonas sp.]